MSNYSNMEEGFLGTSCKKDLILEAYSIGKSLQKRIRHVTNHLLVLSMPPNLQLAVTYSWWGLYELRIKFFIKYQKLIDMHDFIGIKNKQDIKKENRKTCNHNIYIPWFGKEPLR